eukprot:TRINITY_DN4606_c0_g3_i21.p1 TRINITY_DN4606_c0_g3~~TRINITY_DN4606_c0_g3_i21.p1  ORF type:complete len:264 (-),score=44.16 TRINITY_DN4606_c0_g3_i21:927-1718(-)
MDVSVLIMVVVQRVTALAFNYYDGATNTNPKEDPRRGFFEQTYAIKQLPGILPFLGWIYMPAILPMGPFVEYKHFESNANNNNRLPSSPVPHACRKLFVGFLFLGIFQVGRNYGDLDRFRDPEFLNNNGVLYLLAYLIMSNFVIRCKYYFAFKVSEGAAIISGLGYRYNQLTGSHDWDACKSIDVKNFELASSVSMASASWNIQTSQWLKRYVFLRLERGVNLYVTYFVSAIWHGFYPGRHVPLHPVVGYGGYTFLWQWVEVG